MAALAGLISDVLVPLASMTRDLAVLAGLAFVVCAVPQNIAPRVDELGRHWLRGAWRVVRQVFYLVSPAIHMVGRKLFRDYWQQPMVGFFALSAVVLAIANTITAAAPNGGWLGSTVPQVRTFQEAFDLVAVQTTEIAENTREIRDDTGQIRNDTGQIREDTGQIREDIGQIAEDIGQPDQETSTDPRKELANLGVLWTTEAFVAALKANDLRTVDLFLDGGMSPTELHKDASAILYVLQPGLPGNHTPVLDLIAARGYDFEDSLIDYYIMPSYSERLPVTFENDDPPAQIYGYFEGPALLWVVMVSSYFGPTDHDLATIRFLLDQGVDTRLAQAYMKATESWNGDNRPFKEVSAILPRADD